MAINRIPAITQRIDEFTSSGTWVCPAGVYTAEFLVVGAGGGGGGAYCQLVTYAVGAGGGGGGAVKTVRLKTTPGSSYTITIGAKGTGGTNTSGGNGGFSEVVLSGTTLIRSLGGQGGGGINTTPARVAAAYFAMAGGGGVETSPTSTDDTQTAGGGGGANLAFTVQPLTVYGGPVTTSTGIEGVTGKQASTTGTHFVNTQGHPGINGYGAGGNGAIFSASTALAGTPAAPYGAGAGGILDAVSGASNGSNATIAGCGGGGGCVALTAATGSSGGNGADGLVRIFYNA